MNWKHGLKNRIKFCLCGNKFKAERDCLTRDQKFCSRKCSNFNQKGKSKPNHKLYKGDEASYEAKHARIYRLLGKANCCENPKCNDKSKKYHWANISGKHLHNKGDWIKLCVICHSAFDRGKLDICEFLIKRNDN